LGHADDESKLELFDTPQDFRASCRTLANLIKRARHVVLYTGAGISTSAKLPDYRGPDGMWTNKDQGTEQEKDKYVATISDAAPTLAHVAIAELVRRGHVKFVVSTNVDGLHMRSGLKRGTNLAELHGNSYLEVCEACGESYLRPQDVLQRQTPEHRAVNRHWCGGRCEKAGCNGLLLDNIVAFGENLPEDQLQRAIEESERGDLAICLGTTMMVQPACLLPEHVYSKPGGSLVIGNLQKTPYDQAANVLVRGHIDDMFALIMAELGIPIPEQTADGMWTPRYDVDIDKKYREKHARSQADLKRVQADKKNQKSNALIRGENPNGRVVITQSGKEGDVVMSSLDLLLFQDCTQCKFRVTDKTKKIVIS
jgi:NAD-dependent SIR2 family protein deacetylase